jgi:hypothetical protein
LLAHRAPGASALVVVDQLEELFTQASADQRAAFLDALRALRTEPRCAVIYTLRADFSGALMESPLWPERPAQLSRVDVTPLRGTALREAIAAPAEGVGVTVEPELIERLVADAASEPGILPLLQEALVQLWDTRADQTLTLAVGDDGAEFARVLQTMVDDRLLTVDDDVAGEPQVDLAHEVMISAWPTLAGWIRNHRGERATAPPVRGRCHRVGRAWARCARSARSDRAGGRGTVAADGVGAPARAKRGSRGTHRSESDRTEQAAQAPSPRRGCRGSTRFGCCHRCCGGRC